MGSFWTVSTDTDEVSFEISIGGVTKSAKLWLKRVLSTGEARAANTAGFKAVGGLGDRTREADPEIRVDWSAQSFARTLAYVTDWDLTDDKGNKLAINFATIHALRTEVHDAIEGAINAHIERQEALRKNTQAGASEQPATSA